MLTLGISCGLSGPVTYNTQFTDSSSAPINVTSTYIYCASSGALVYQNSAGNPQYAPTVPTGYNPIAASQILASATVDGVLRTTTIAAADMTWWGSYNA